MTRVVSLFLPTWPTDRLRRKPGAAAPPPEMPLVLVGREGRRRVVLAADAAALRAGLRVGMPATKAQALVAGLVVHGRRSRRRRRGAGAPGALGAAALCADRRRRSARRPRHRHHRRRPSAWRRGGHARRPGRALGGLGHRRARGGRRQLGRGPRRRALAGAGRRWSCRPARARRRSRPLPIAALRLPGDIVDGLRSLGFDRIGDLAAQPRAPLTLRFGPELGRRLDQAMGRLAEPIDAGPPAGTRSRSAAPSPSRSARPRPSPATSASWSTSSARRSRLRGLGARRLDLLFHRVDNRDRGDPRRHRAAGARRQDV